ncbi:uncharacterized protein BO80DRAFT_496641 [Aspergillus ibericus CBS 121593]|uniref:D-serine dehydratase-like domain-containing protein n=1 Tax=Aspergillus ibericus CBS 121593 TaxID=1448316 RepID=A0A395GN94_9EURO|nr:hypothetical protein BO80DRAFT_496641 [Aspergillus ibericus CBS 121593]RAK96975.1 hypothetical protein BO80DRAFT_496641 [Aspergillus ibericus CBS 121593]
MASSIPLRPLASQSELQAFYIGKDINDVPKPAVILDVAIIRRHCAAMLEATRELGVGFRAHVKTHKTPQIAHLQVGDIPNTPANFVISTVLEGETLLPLFQELFRAGRPVNVLYGIPLVPSQVPRLAHLAKQIAAGSISVMIDHPDQIDHLRGFRDIAGFAAGVFLKVDSGYHRAGLPPDGLNKGGLVEKIITMEKEGVIELIGVYSHNSLSYAGSTLEEGMQFLREEILGCREAIRQHTHLLSARQAKGKELVISVGATPQVVSIKGLLQGGALSPSRHELKALLHQEDSDDIGRITVELHAGVYPILDMQQLSTNTHTGPAEDEIAISVVAEVCSVYNNAERSTPEALIAAGSLALGREPCPSYPGWGVVSEWRRPKGPGRLIVQRISQEHAILGWEKGKGGEEGIPLRVGQSVRIFPNHACVTGALYGWYLVVDSSREGEGEGERVVDVWTRPTGW